MCPRCGVSFRTHELLTVVMFPGESAKESAGHPVVIHLDCERPEERAARVKLKA